MAAIPIVLSGRDIVRFWSKVKKAEGDGCWEWNAALDGGGYGMFWIRTHGNNVKAHRVAYYLGQGEIPDDLFVLHSCDNRKCVRHLRLGTQSENQQERWAKGRAKIDRPPSPARPPTPSTEERFWSKVSRAESDGCWMWQASVRTNGYGQFVLDGRPVNAHRAAYILMHGAVPDGFDVCHRCDVRRCVNPAHLFLGTRLDNMRDCAAKGRIARGDAVGKHMRGDNHWARKHPERVKRGVDSILHQHPFRGERNGNAKLRDQDVARMRMFFDSGTADLTELARQYPQVGRGRIREIVKRQGWKHLA